MTTPQTHKITNPEASRGCWIEGHRGWTWTPDGSNTWPPSRPEEEREVIGQRDYL